MELNGMIEHGTLAFEPQPLAMVTWRPDTQDAQVKGVIAALHGFGVHAELGFHYLGPFMAERGWITVAIDLPGFGHWQPPGKRAMKGHWKMVPPAVAALLHYCTGLAPGKPVVLLGSSLGGLASIDYVLQHHDAASTRIDAVVALVPAIGRISLPWYLWLGAAFALVIAPHARVGIARYSGMDSHDPASIILQPDPIALDKVSIGLLASIFSTMNKSGTRGKGYARWNPRIPIYLLSAGMDNLVKGSDVEEFHDHLPEGTRKLYKHHENDYHGVLYEADRDEIFLDIDAFLCDVLNIEIH